MTRNKNLHQGWVCPIHLVGMNLGFRRRFRRVEWLLTWPFRPVSSIKSRILLKTSHFWLQNTRFTQSKKKEWPTSWDRISSWFHSLCRRVWNTYYETQSRIEPPFVFIFDTSSRERRGTHSFNPTEGGLTQRKDYESTGLGRLACR